MDEAETRMQKSNERRIPKKRQKGIPFSQEFYQVPGPSEIYEATFGSFLEIRRTDYPASRLPD